MLRCKELVANASDLLDSQLNLRQRLAVQMHLAMCYRCRRFIKQLRLSQRVLRALPEAAIPELEELSARLAEQQRARR